MDPRARADAGLRELLRKRYGCQVSELKYDDYSKSAKEKIKTQIKEAVELPLPQLTEER